MLLGFAFAFLGVALPAAEVAFKVVDQKNQPVVDAVVSLVPLDGTAPPAVASTSPPLEIEQKRQEFIPYVTAIRAGTAIRFPNRDTVEHHAYSQSPARKFELPLYKPGRAETLLFERPGVVTVGCNIHDWMIAYVVVLSTPWLALTPAPGEITLGNVPAGRYRAEVWHPRLAKVQTREITVAPSANPAPVSFQLTLKADQRVRRAPDASGRGYR
ncbi:MAG: methylamine utilization protein [Opitutaceae bacterium]|nr:methylamine utilization protein [Opitutaceae bacterium]